MKSSKILFPLLALIVLSACEPRIDFRGKLPDHEQVAQIRTGTSTQNDVLNLIGSPTFETEFGPKQWFYVYKKMHTKSFFQPVIKEKNMLAITFNDQGVATNVERLAQEDLNIDPIRYKTKTVGHDQPILQQIFGNFGRIARKPQGKA